MIKAERVPGREPSSLDEQYRDDTTELDRATQHYVHNTTTTSFDFGRYRSADVKQILDEIFHGKCAYCESFYAKTQPVDVEHFRPKGGIEGEEDHRGYWWLAMDWNNLVPSCIDCNRKRKQKTPEPVQNNTMVLLNDNGEFARGKIFKTGKQSAFPLEAGSARARWDTTTKDLDLGIEKCLLLDPTRNDPGDHIVFHVDRTNPEKMISIAYPKPLEAGMPLTLPILGDSVTVAANANQNRVSAIGAVSIQVYGLNRLSLVQARTKVLRDLEFLLEMSISLTSLNTEIDQRIGNRDQQIINATGATKTQLEDDQGLDKRINECITQLADKVVAQMIGMAEPNSQFSALAKAWITEFIE